MPLQMKLLAITLDCADPQALAAFYHRATGFALHPESHGDFAGVAREDGLAIGFQRVDDYTPPLWPGQSVPQQFHMDFEVDDLDDAVAQLLERARERRSTSRAVNGGGSSPTRPGTPSA